jgi:hypothetical protein
MFLAEPDKISVKLWAVDKSAFLQNSFFLTKNYANSLPIKKNTSEFQVTKAIRKTSSILQHQVGSYVRCQAEIIYLRFKKINERIRKICDILIFHIGENSSGGLLVFEAM